MAESPTQRTLRECRKRKWPVDVAEHWVSSHLTRAVVDEAQRFASCENQTTLANLLRAVDDLRHGMAGQRRDLFGCIDVLTIDTETNQIVGIQACAVGSQRRRWNKIRVECLDDALAWVKCGQRLEIWGWGAYKVKRGGKAVRWRPTITPITQADLEELLVKPF